MDYYRVSKIDDLIESVSEATSQVLRMIDRDLTPKWALIAMHASVQGAMVLALDQGNGLASMKAGHAKKWLEAYESNVGAPYPETQLDYFLSLYEKIKDEEYMSNYGAVPFTPTDHDSCVKELNNLRNNFIHFQAGAWSIEKLLVQKCLLGAVDVIAFLIDSPVFPWHRRENALSDREALHLDLKSISAYLNIDARSNT